MFLGPVLLALGFVLIKEWAVPADMFPETLDEAQAEAHDAPRTR